MLTMSQYYYFSRQTFTPSAITSHVGSAGDLLHRTTAKTMAVLTTTSMTTKAVLSAVGDHRWWKESLNYLRPLQVRPLTACVCVLNWPAMEQMRLFPAQSLLNKPASLANSTPVVAMCCSPSTTEYLFLSCNSVCHCAQTIIRAPN